MRGFCIPRQRRCFCLFSLLRCEEGSILRLREEKEPEGTSNSVKKKYPPPASRKLLPLYAPGRKKRYPIYTLAKLPPSSLQLGGGGRQDEAIDQMLSRSSQMCPSSFGWPTQFNFSSLFASKQVGWWWWGYRPRGDPNLESGGRGGTNLAAAFDPTFPWGGGKALGAGGATPATTTSRNVTCKDF